MSGAGRAQPQLFVDVDRSTSAPGSGLGARRDAEVIHVELLGLLLLGEFHLVTCPASLDRRARGSAELDLDGAHLDLAELLAGGGAHHDALGSAGARDLVVVPAAGGGVAAGPLFDIEEGGRAFTIVEGHVDLVEVERLAGFGLRNRELTRQACPADLVQGVAELRAKGMTVVENVDKAKFVATLAPVNAEFEKQFGKANLDKIRDFK